VPPDSPFYPFVERMVLHGAISGYADGTFHPGAKATRGQTAKIVANSFFPNCTGQEPEQAPPKTK
jgi:hypothetical protein